jgi:hypothetical protein
MEISDNQPSRTVLERYLRHRRTYSAALLCAVVMLTTMSRIFTQLIDVSYSGLTTQLWEPVVWELSSVIVILALVPAILVFDRHVPLTWANWRRAFPKHLLASVVFSVVHVEAMLLLRKLAYSLVDSHYEFGNWIGQWVYEYAKDVRTYFAFLFLIYVYRFILLRLQGEASELAAPETGSTIEAPKSPDKYPERFLVRKLDKEFLIAAQEIEWLEAQGNYINLHVRGHVYPLRSTMAGLEARLDPQNFIRVHRSYIVNLEFLVEIEPLDSGDAKITLRNGIQLQCSRTYRAALKERVSRSDMLKSTAM